MKDRTKSFALGIIRLFIALPKSPEAQIIDKQLLSSGTSVGANYRGSFRSRSKAEFIAKAGDSLKELGGTAYWLELMEEGALEAINQSLTGRNTAKRRSQIQSVLATLQSLGQT